VISGAPPASGEILDPRMRVAKMETEVAVRLFFIWQLVIYNYSGTAHGVDLPFSELTLRPRGRGGGGSACLEKTALPHFAWNALHRVVGCHMLGRPMPLASPLLPFCSPLRRAVGARKVRQSRNNGQAIVEGLCPNGNSPITVNVFRDATASTISYIYGILHSSGASIKGESTQIARFIGP
jgi:hypothetical protein